MHSLTIREGEMSELKCVCRRTFAGSCLDKVDGVLPEDQAQSGVEPPGE